MSPLTRTIALLAACAVLAGAQTLTVTTTALPEAVAGVAYSYTLTATGGTPPYGWRFPLGELVPPFLSLSPGGLLSGTPRSAEAGKSCSFRVQVSDAGERAAQASLTLSVRGAAPAALAITTASLPPGRLNAPHAQTLAAAGGIPPYAWTVVSGGLPPGLRLDAASGALEGTPTLTGEFTFTVRVTDAAGVSVAQALSLTVTGAGSDVFPVGPQPGAGAPVAVAVDPARRRAYVLVNAQPWTVVVLEGAARRSATPLPLLSTVKAIAIDPRSRAYVSDHTVLDGESGDLLASVPVGQRPVGIALEEAAGRVYVASQQSGAISVVDTAAYRVLETWRPAAGNVWGLALDTRLRQLYVTVPPNLIGDFSGLEVLDTATGQVKALIPTGGQPEMVAVNPRNGLVFVSDSYDATVTVIDGATLRVLAVHATGKGPRDLAVDPSSGAVYVGNVYDGTVQRLPETP